MAFPSRFSLFRCGWRSERQGVSRRFPLSSSLAAPFGVPQGVLSSTPATSPIGWRRPGRAVAQIAHPVAALLVRCLAIGPLLLASHGLPAASAGVILEPLRIAAPELQHRRGDTPVKHSPSPTNITELDQAVQYFDRGEYDRSLELLAAARKAHPTLPPPRLILARFFIAENLVRNARPLLEQVVAAEPGYPGVYLVLGEVALAEGRISDALLNFEKSVSLVEAGSWSDLQKVGFLAESYAGLASVAAVREDWAAAQTHLERWLEVEPQSGQAHQRLARALFALGKPDDAYQQLQRAHQLDPSLEPAAVAMGWLYTQAGRMADASQWMQRAAESLHDDAKALCSVATWFLQQGKPEEAKRYARRAADLDPASRQARLLSAQAAWHVQQLSEAETLLEPLHQQAPGDFQVSDMLAQVLAEQADAGKRRRALQLAEVNARQYPNSSEALATLGWAHYQLGQVSRAEQALRAALSAESVQSDTLYYLARVLASQDHRNSVPELLSKALAAPGLFVHRREAAQWARLLQQPTKVSGDTSSSTPKE